MQPYGRISARVVPRVCRPAVHPARNMFTTPFFPSHWGAPAFGGDFAPLLRLLDSATADLVPSTISSSCHARQQQQLRTFTPRFDVREIGSSYELQGELPGIEQKDLEIEFVDERTLVIRGKTASESVDTNDRVEPVKVVAGEEAVTSDDVSEKSASYRKPSVEEEYVDAGAESEAEGVKSSTSVKSAVAEEAKRTETPKIAPAESNLKYWVSERFIGEFERRFSFPGRVDQEAVKASLKNGILSVVVPKVVAKEAKRIQIE